MSDKGNRLRRMRESSVWEHRELLGELRGVEAMAEASPSPASGDVARKLHALAQQIELHMKEEERSDLYRWLPEQFPDLRDELLSVGQEHATLVEEVKRLRVACESADVVEFDDELGIGIRLVVADLRKHEAKESALVRRALAAAAG